MRQLASVASQHCSAVAVCAVEARGGAATTLCCRKHGSLKEEGCSIFRDLRVIERGKFGGPGSSSVCMQCAVVLPAALCCALLKLLQRKPAVFAAMYSFEWERHAFCKRGFTNEGNE
eukprot:2153-Heterococcus_DN1.PRE.6